MRIFSSFGYSNLMKKNMQELADYTSCHLETDDDTDTAHASSTHDADRDAVRLISLLSAMGLEGNWNSEVLECADQSRFVVGVRCLAHTLQLVVKWGISKAIPKVSALINLTRTITKALRVQTKMYELKEAKLFTVCPRLDVPTRWSSTFEMVSI